MKIAFFADTHNNKWFERVIAASKQLQADRIVSLGDISAVDTADFLKSPKLYSSVWVHKKGNKDIIVSEKDLEWFDTLNVLGWNRQMDILEAQKKKLVLCVGNSDFAMFQWYDGRLKKPQCLEVAKDSTLLEYGKACILVLPYNSGALTEDLIRQIAQLKLQNLFVVSHCPPMPRSPKAHYTQLYQNLKALSPLVPQITMLHGHTHPCETYAYQLPELKNITIIALKADDTTDGIGSHSHIALLDSESMEISFFNTDLTEIKPLPLPKEYYLSDRHWNLYSPDGPAGI